MGKYQLYLFRCNILGQATQHIIVMHYAQTAEISLKVALMIDKSFRGVPMNRRNQLFWSFYKLAADRGFEKGKVFPIETFMPRNSLTVLGNSPNAISESMMLYDAGDPLIYTVYDNTHYVPPPEVTLSGAIIPPEMTDEDCAAMKSILEQWGVLEANRVPYPFSGTDSQWY